METWNLIFRFTKFEYEKLIKSQNSWNKKYLGK